MSNLQKFSRYALTTLGAVCIVAASGYGVYSYSHLQQENSVLTQQLTQVEAERSDLLARLTDASTTLSQIDAQIGSITSTVGTLQKIANTDPELLKKYSKVYFLNENYVPKGLIQIGSEYAYNGKDIDFLSAAYPFLTSMLNAAQSDGMHLYVESAYRSFYDQSSLKSSYRVTYGAGTANSFSADQGYSEHQLGTAVDFTTSSLKGGLTGFDRTPEYVWLRDNAYQYGFVLSYPANNSYYVYEPWHWRFIGVALATRLHEEKQYFYELTERQIDPYVAKLFDTTP